MHQYEESINQPQNVKNLGDVKRHRNCKPISYSSFILFFPFNGLFIHACFYYQTLGVLLDPCSYFV